MLRLESEIGTTLPEQYRSFLFQYNGGIPSPNIVDVDKATGMPTDVQEFFGVRQRLESSNISWNAQTFADRLPGGLLPIACDSGGNLFCLSLSGEDLGSVVYAAFDTRVPEFYPVSIDVGAFLAKLRDWPFTHH